MSLYLFSLGATLLIGRGLYTIWRTHLGPRGHTIFWIVLAALGFVEFVVLGQTIGLASSEVLGIWALLGVVGWFLPEIIRTGIAFIRRLSLKQQLIGLGIVLTTAAVFQDANNAKLIMAIVLMVTAIYLIIRKGFRL